MPPTLAPILKTLLFTIVVPGTVGGYVPYLLLGPRAHAELGGVGVLGALAIAIGTAGYLSCAWNFAYRGLGTPAPLDPPKTLIVQGLNRYIRNPMYVSVLLVILGQAALFRAPLLVLYGAFMWTCAHLFVVFYEEATLRKTFGPQYDEYRKRVPRWMPKFGASR